MARIYCQCLLACVLSVLWSNFGTCEVAPSSDTLKAALLQIYESEMSAARNARTKAKINTAEALKNFVVDQIKTVADFKVTFLESKRNFEKETESLKESYCFDYIKSNITVAEEQYEHEASNCILNANAEVMKKKKSIHRAIKEIKKWQHGLRYIASVCQDQHFTEFSSTGKCFTDYVTKEHYDKDVLRQVTAIETLQGKLSQHIEDCLEGLRSCLAEDLLEYEREVKTLNTVQQLCTEGHSTSTEPVPMNLKKIKCAPN